MAPVPVEQLFTQAMHHYRAGRLTEAETPLRQILLLNPRDAGALNLLGVIRAQLNDHPGALELLSRAIAVNPNVASYHLNRGRALAGLNRLDDAIASLNRARELNPRDTNVLVNLGTVLRTRGRLEESEACFREVLALRPDDADSYCNLGATLLAQNRADEAIALYHSALAIKPDFAGIYNNLGNACLLKRDVPQALIHYRRAVQLAPAVPMVHHNLGQALLLSGDFQNGWREHEWRTSAAELNLNLMEFPQPLWDGGDLIGRRIYLQPEQGFGDFIQFVRYVPLVAQRGGRVILGCSEPLLELAQSIPGVEQIARHGQPIPQFDVHCPLAGLPLRFNTTLQTIRATVPYLRANSQSVQHWRRRIQSFDSRIKIGLAWAGNADHKNDRNRSMRQEDLLPVAQISGAVLFSLQKGAAANQSAATPKGCDIIDWTDELNSFADTAALLDNLDLVISVDTAVAHLAGAMGKPVWVLLPFNGEWRWLLDREDSPWYPTMKLFRQSKLGDWKTPVERINEALRVFK